MSDDLGERTEEATPRRRAEARSEGNIARSQDLSSVILLVAGTLIAALALFPTLWRFAGVVEAVLSGDRLGDPLDPGQALAAVKFVAGAGARIAAPLLLAAFVAGIIAHLVQVGWLFSPKTLRPNLNKLNPLNGARRLFGLSALVKVVMDLGKVAAGAAIVVVTVMQYRERIVVLAYLDPLQGLLETGWLILDLAMRLLALLLVLAIIDFTYQKWKHNEDLKMTKFQVKDEMKQTEGDPAVKRRRLRMQQQIAMQRIATAVPRADVIVTNPEHVSVAIQYDAENMNAPTVVAKGADFLALRIRQIALMRGIPIVERPPLARSLYKAVAVGQEVPPQFYHAVAEVLAFVYRLQGRRAG